MSIEENRRIVRRFYESIGNEKYIRNIRKARNREAEAEKVVKDIFTKAYTPDCLIHSTAGDRSLKEEMKDTALYIAACPDSKATIEDMIAEGDKVVTRWTMCGIHEGSVRDIIATNKQEIVKGITIKRMVKGKVVEEWASIDMLSLLQMIGAMPPK